MAAMIWQRCLGQLQEELPAQQFNTWIKPLQLDYNPMHEKVRLLAPNRFIMGWVEDKFLERIQELFGEINGELPVIEVSASNYGDKQQYEPFKSWPRVEADVPELVNGADQGAQQLNGDSKICGETQDFMLNIAPSSDKDPVVELPKAIKPSPSHKKPVANADVDPDNLNEKFSFDNFIEGKSNQLARAAAQQVAENPGGSYNPLFIYGGVGLGKTHLMHAVGNALRERKPDAKIVYLHSERFVADMVKALQLNAINDFKRFYRSVDALLIDDIQFFARKERSQEEFFHTFNALLEGGHQMILTCDRYPKEIVGVEERLKSRFGWGLTVAVEPPELETRVAILIKKAQQASVDLPYESAFFIAQRVSSNVRELEGALKRVIAGAHFTRRPIDIDLIREALKDLLALQDKLVTIDNIQRIAADYYKLKISDMLSKRRTRSVARPRQVAMALAKEMTDHSLPEIGEAFGGRDHTTVLHACRRIKELQTTSSEIREDIKLLTRALKT